MKNPQSSSLALKLLSVVWLLAGFTTSLFGQETVRSPFPRVVQAAAPNYPQSLLPVRAEGRVVVSVAINPKGEVIEATLSDGPALFVPNALAAARVWTFIPIDSKKLRTTSLTFMFHVVDKPEQTGAFYVSPGMIEVAAFSDNPRATEVFHDPDLTGWYGPEVVKSSGVVYGAVAKAAHVTGIVDVKISINSAGVVVSAEALDGHPLIKSSAVESAKKWQFVPTSTMEQRELVLHFHFVQSVSADELPIILSGAYTIVVPQIIYHFDY